VHELTSASGRDPGVLPDASRVQSVRHPQVGVERTAWHIAPAGTSPGLADVRHRIAQGLNDPALRRLFPARKGPQAALGLQANTAWPERSATPWTNWTRPSATSAAPSPTSHFSAGLERPDRARQRADNGAQYSPRDVAKSRSGARRSPDGRVALMRGVPYLDAVPVTGMRGCVSSAGPELPGRRSAGQARDVGTYIALEAR